MEFLTLLTWMLHGCYTDDIQCSICRACFCFAELVHHANPVPQSNCLTNFPNIILAFHIFRLLSQIDFVTNRLGFVSWDEYMKLRHDNEMRDVTAALIKLTVLYRLIPILSDPMSLQFNISVTILI